MPPDPIKEASIIKPVICRKLTDNDLEPLLHYLQQLSDESKSRFGPHPFNRDAVVDFYRYNTGLTGYVAINILQQEIIAYAIIKAGILHHEYDRLAKYGSGNINDQCCSFAPSVADKWQSKGIGKLLFNYILSDLIAGNIKQVILWGGVQAGNEKAVRFYRKLGFQTLGSFEYNGANLDMLLNIG